jgi:hypothetical protein
MSLDKEEVNGSVGECEGPLETGDVEMEGYEETEAHDERDDHGKDKAGSDSEDSSDSDE